MIIYELHIGTFRKNGETPGPGDLEGAIERLDHLKELGVDALEVMPLAEFPGGYSWGYNPSLIFPFESDHGSPRSFREFVQIAHESSIAVIVDVVYNHFGPGDLHLWQFDGWNETEKGGIYFYNDWRAETPWGRRDRTTDASPLVPLDTPQLHRPAGRPRASWSAKRGNSRRASPRFRLAGFGHPHGRARRDPS
jgi:1,4-alpha-glucan branching enzyme